MSNGTFVKKCIKKAKGVALDDNMIYDLSVDQESRYGKDGSTALFQLAYNFQLSNKWHLYLAGNYKHALASNYTTQAPIAKKYNALGLSFGVNLKL